MTAPLHIAVLDGEVDITALISNYLGGRGFRVTLELVARRRDGSEVMVEIARARAFAAHGDPLRRPSDPSDY